MDAQGRLFGWFKDRAAAAAAEPRNRASRGRTSEQRRSSSAFARCLLRTRGVFPAYTGRRKGKRIHPHPRCSKDAKLLAYRADR